MEILEIFWTKEVREKIKEYRAKDVLNEEALSHLKNITRKFVFIYPLAILGMFFILMSKIEPILAVILLCWPIFVVRLVCICSYTAYFGNKKIKVKLVNKIKGGMISSFIFRNENEKFRSVIYCMPKSKNDDLPDVAEEVSVYLVEPSPKRLTHKRVMPDIDFIKRKYSLTTEIL